MSPFDPALVGTGDDLHTACMLYVVLRGVRGNWTAHVQGLSPDDTWVSVAWYDASYPLKSEAQRRAGQLLRHVRDLRLAAL